MIELPTRRRLERRRHRLYVYLNSIIHYANIYQVENIMRQIHSINFKLRTYFKGGLNCLQQELFIDPNEDNDITTQDTATGDIDPTTEELAHIEEQIQKGEIKV